MRSHEVCIFLVHFEAKDSPGCTKLNATFRRDAILASTTLGFISSSGLRAYILRNLKRTLGPSPYDIPVLAFKNPAEAIFRASYHSMELSPFNSRNLCVTWPRHRIANFDFGSIAGHEP